MRFWFFTIEHPCFPCMFFVFVALCLLLSCFSFLFEMKTALVFGVLFMCLFFLVFLQIILSILLEFCPLFTSLLPFKDPSLSSLSSISPLKSPICRPFCFDICSFVLFCFDSCLQHTSLRHTFLETKLLSFWFVHVVVLFWLFLCLLHVEREFCFWNLCFPDSQSYCCLSWPILGPDKCFGPKTLQNLWYSAILEYTAQTATQFL